MIVVQEKGEETSSAATAWARSAHQWWPHLDGEHHTTGQEGPATAGLFQEAEGVQDVIKAPRSYDSCIVESLLTSCRAVWYGSTGGHKRPQRVVSSAEKITRPPPPSLLSIYPHRVHRRAASTLNDPLTPSTSCSLFDTQVGGTSVENSTCRL